MRVVALVPDLMDRSRLAGPAAAAGVGVQFVGSAAALVEEVGAGDVGLVLLDLGRPDVLDLAGRLPPGLRVVGFASHVDEATLAAARAAGVEALARSAFFRGLPKLLGSAGAG